MTQSADDDVAVRQIGSRVVYQNNWMSVREDDIEFADGTRSIYGVVEKADYALVIAAEPSESGTDFHLVEQYRYAISRRSLEFPMGGWPTGKGGSALELARAELREETGFTARTWQHIGHLVQSTGYSPQAFDIYLATDLEPGDHSRESSEGDMIHSVVSEVAFRAMILNGTITDGPTIAAYAMFVLHRDDASVKSSIEP